MKADNELAISLPKNENMFEKKINKKLGKQKQNEQKKKKEKNFLPRK